MWMQKKSKSKKIKHPYTKFNLTKWGSETMRWNMKIIINAQIHQCLDLINPPLLAEFCVQLWLLFQTGPPDLNKSYLIDIDDDDSSITCTHICHSVGVLFDDMTWHDSSYHFNLFKLPIWMHIFYQVDSLRFWPLGPTPYGIVGNGTFEEISKLWLLH